MKKETKTVGEIRKTIYVVIEASFGSKMTPMLHAQLKRLLGEHTQASKESIAEKYSKLLNQIKYEKRN
jgi:hypothetical protein